GAGWLPRPARRAGGGSAPVGPRHTGSPRATRATPPLVGLAMTSHTLTIHRLGRVEYEDGLKLQALFAAARKEGKVGDSLLLLEHPPVLTLGRGASRADVL